MQPDSYGSMANVLAKVGLVCQMRNENQDVVALCAACMGGAAAMYRVPTEIMAQFKLQELDQNEYDRLFGSN